MRRQSRPSRRGCRSRSASKTATGSSATDTQLTHAKCAESTRWMPWEIMPRPKSPDAKSTCAWKRRGVRFTAMPPDDRDATTTTIMKKNQMNSCCDDEKWGSGHRGGWIAPDRCRNPSRWSHDGGIGSRRPPRR